MDAPPQPQASILLLTAWLGREHAIGVKDGTEERACDQGEEQQKSVILPLLPRTVMRRYFPESCKPSPYIVSSLQRVHTWGSNRLDFELVVALH